LAVHALQQDKRCKQCCGFFSAEPGSKSYLPKVFWSEKSSSAKYATPAVKAALSKEQCVLLQQQEGIENTGEPNDIIACPLFLNEKLHGFYMIFLQH